MNKLNKKPGLTIKQFHNKDISESVHPNTRSKKISTKEKSGETLELVPCNIIEALESIDEDENQSDYEIETLDDSDSDSKVTKKRKSNDTEFIKIRNTYFMCILCLKKYGSMKELTEHMNDPNPCSLTSYRCEICDKEFNSKSRLSTHLTTHKEKLQYFCDKCGESFKNTQKLFLHLEMMHTEYFDLISSSNFQCKLCDHKSVTRDLMLQHINLNHLHVTMCLCHICGKSFMNEVRLKVHIMTHRDTKSFLCQICSKSFKTPSSLQAHIKTHDTTKQFICESCGKAFKKSGALKEHKKIHDKDTYSCVICDRSFLTRFDLDEHIKIHL